MSKRDAGFLEAWKEFIGWRQDELTAEECEERRGVDREITVKLNEIRAVLPEDKQQLLTDLDGLYVKLLGIEVDNIYQGALGDGARILRETQLTA